MTNNTNYIDLQSKIKFSFGLQEQARLINVMRIVVTECLAHIAYYLTIKNIDYSLKEQDWFNYTRNAYYDLTIGNWCKLFGANSEPTHYHKLIEKKYALRPILEQLGINPVTKENLKNFILSEMQVSKKDFDEFWEKTRDYRNRALIHHVHDPAQINDGDLDYPEIEIILKTAYPLFKNINIIAAAFPKKQDTANHYKVMYYNFANKNELFDYFKQTFPQKLSEKFD